MDNNINLLVLFYLTIVIFPIITLRLSSMFDLVKYKIFIKRPLLIFLAYNLFCFLGLSFKGDFIDYIILSFEYVILIVILFAIRPKSKYVNFIRYVGVSVILICTFFCVMLFPFLIVVTQDFVSDKHITFESNNKVYKVRRYVFGFATLSNTRYTFVTYRTFKYLPFEYKIDKSDFFDDESVVNVADDKLQIFILKKHNQDCLVFKSSDGSSFVKKIN